MLPSQQGNDPVMALGQLITSLQTIISRNLSAFDSAVITIGEVSSVILGMLLQIMLMFKARYVHSNLKYKIILNNVCMILLKD